MGVVTLVAQPDEQIERVGAGSVALDPRIVGRSAIERQIAHILQGQLGVKPGSRDARTCAGIALLGEGSVADWSVGAWRHDTRGGDAAEDTVRLIGESSSVEQCGPRLIGVTVSKHEGP